MSSGGTGTLIQPILIDGSHYCCIHDGFRRTNYLVSGDARVEENTLILLEAKGDPNNDYNTGRVHEGQVKFGICCANNMHLAIEGQIETKDDSFDWLRITLNPDSESPQELYFKESKEPPGDPDDPAGVTNVTAEVSTSIPCDPCGNIVLLESSTGDASANNDIWWRVSVTLS